jgi:tetratricopeptide (TPR) repeat protein
MNAHHSFVNRQDPNRKWVPISQKTSGRLATVKLVSENGQKQSDQSLRACVQSKAKQGDYLGAIALLTQLISRHPNDAVNYNNRGLIYFQSGQREKAIADYNKALQLNPELDSAYNNRGNYYASVGQLAEALADYEKALDLNAGNIRTWINQAITFRELGLYDLALENLDMAVILGCLEDHIYAERGRTYHLRGDWNCAIADYQRALKELPPSGASGRLRLQVETWMSQLLNPLTA